MLPTTQGCTTGSVVFVVVIVRNSHSFMKTISADFERMRQEKIIKGEQEEGKAIRDYWQMARNEEVVTGWKVVEGCDA